jgi:hypothetical protein
MILCNNLDTTRPCFVQPGHVGISFWLLAYFLICFVLRGHVGIIFWLVSINLISFSSQPLSEVVVHILPMWFLQTKNCNICKLKPPIYCRTNSCILMCTHRGKRLLRSCGSNFAKNSMISLSRRYFLVVLVMIYSLREWGGGDPWDRNVARTLCDNWFGIHCFLAKYLGEL